MSKLQESASFAGNSNIIRLIPTRNARLRIAALAIVLALVSLAAASGMRTDWAGSQGGPVVQPPETASASVEFVYFPGQYQNQATEQTEHIQSF